MLKCVFSCAFFIQIFQWLEQPYELEQSAILQGQLVEERNALITLCKEAHQSREYDQNLLEKRMEAYEEVLKVSVFFPFI